MELKVQKPTFPEAITFNFEELKQEIAAKSELYSSMVYTADQVPAAKKDVATLRKFTTALEDERKKIKKECLKPYEEFEAKIKELVGIVNDSIGNIAGQLEGFEENRKAEKLDKIKELWEQTEHPEWLLCKAIFDQRWLNATTTMKQIEAAIKEKIVDIESDIATLESLPEFSFEAIETYKTDLNLTNAIKEGQRLADIQKRKVEAEAAACSAKAEPTPEMTAEQPQTPFAEARKVLPKSWVKFQAHMTETEALELKKFFEDRCILFRAI